MINDQKTHWKLKVHSGNKIIDQKTPAECKIQLTLLINFMSSKDSEETRTMHTKSHNVQIMMGNGIDDIIKGIFGISFAKILRKISRKMIESEFIFDSVDLLNYHLQNRSPEWARSYIDSPKWLKNKKGTTNPKNNDDNCFQYALTLALIY